MYVDPQFNVRYERLVAAGANGTATASGTNAIASAFLGSVSQALVHASPVPVTIVTNGPTNVRPAEEALEEQAAQTLEPTPEATLKIEAARAEVEGFKTIQTDFEKNKDYWNKPLPYLDGIKVSFYDSKATEFLLFRQHQLDFINDIDASFKDEVLTKKGTLRPAWENKIALDVSPYLNTEYLGILVDTNDIAAEILDADRAILPLGHREVGAMHRSQSTRLGDAMLFAHQESIVIGELFIGRITHVGHGVRVDEQRAEGWRVDAEIHAVVRHLAQHVDTIAIVCREVVAVRFVQAADCSHVGSLPLCLGS